MEKQKSNYQIYRERVVEGAKSYPNPPKEVDQTILWIKAIASEKIESSEEYGEDKGVFTFKNGEKFGFSHPYVNLLMHYAFERGMSRKEEEYKKSIANMSKSLNKIKDALDDVGWIYYPDSW
jgi:hypothetical protein